MSLLTSQLLQRENRFLGESGMITLLKLLEIISFCFSTVNINSCSYSKAKDPSIVTIIKYSPVNGHISSPGGAAVLHLKTSLVLVSADTLRAAWSNWYFKWVSTRPVKSNSGGNTYTSPQFCHNKVHRLVGCNSG